MRRSTRCSQVGYTLVELAIAVTVAGVISSGVAMIGARTWAQHREEMFGSQMTQLVSSIENMFGAGGTYSNLDLVTAVNLGIFTNEVVDTSVSPPRVDHVYRGPITLGVLSSNGFANLGWGLHFARLPGNTCLAVLDYAVALFDAVAVVPDSAAGANVSSFADWEKSVSINNGIVSGFPLVSSVTPPRQYTLVKSGRSARTDVVVVNPATSVITGGKIGICATVTERGSAPYGLSLVRTRQ
jgi:prepilin-type N-terminal cleavage/methylation domain-containing protein